MLCAYSSNALQTFPSNLIFFFFFLLFGALCFWLLVERLQSLRSPVFSGGATGLHFIMCFLFGRERQNWAFSQLETGVWYRLIAGNDGSCSFNECPSKKTDTGHETPPASSTPVQMHVEKQHTVRWSVFFLHKMKLNGNAYIPMFHTTNQASDHNLIWIL